MKGRQFYVALRNGEMPNWMILRECPQCGEETGTVECRWCGYDIAGHEEEASIREAQEYLRLEEEWKE